MSNQVDLTQLAIEREKPPNRVRRRRHLLSRYILPALLLGGFIALAGWASWDRVFPPRPVTVLPVLATGSHVSREGTPLFKAAGWIEPRPTPVRVAALAPGVVSKLLVVEDQAVQAGEPVAELIKEDAELAYRGALANLKLAEAALEEASAIRRAAVTRYENPVHLEAALADAEAALAEIGTELANLPYAVRRAAADLEFARQNFEGKEAAKGAVVGRAIDEARSQHEAAQALVDELRERQTSLESQKSALVRRRDALKTQLALLADELRDKEQAAAKLQAAAARIEQARVAVAEAKLRLERMTVRAPVEGRVYQLLGFPGTTLTSGTGFNNADGSTVVTLYQPDLLQVRVDVRFEDVPHVSLGQAVEIDNPALAAPLDGHVLFISSEADIQKNTLEVKVAIDSPPPVFKPEMLVDTTFLAPQDPASDQQLEESTQLFAPQRLIREDETGSYVWVADQFALVARKTRVETGKIVGNGLVRVTSGLNRTSRLIASGDDELRDGQRIEITSEEATFSSTAPRARARPALSRLPGGGL